MQLSSAMLSCHFIPFGKQKYQNREEDMSDVLSSGTVPFASSYTHHKMYESKMGARCEAINSTGST